MPKEYPVLDNRPINKWKVTELREELKRRDLTSKGLKDELVKRLDEAIRIEREASEAEEGNGPDGSDVENSEDVKADSSDSPEGTVDRDNKELSQVNDVVNQMDSDDAPTQCGQTALELEQVVVSNVTTVAGERSVIVATSDISDVEDKVAQVTSTEEVLNDESLGKAAEVKPEKKTLGSSEVAITQCGQAKAPELKQVVASHVTTVASELSVIVTTAAISDVEEKVAQVTSSEGVLNDESLGKGDEVKPDNKTLESSEVAAAHKKAHSSDQVYDEVSANLGFKVNSESFSTDALINNDNELKDNFNAENLQLESEFVRQEMVQPSSGGDPRGGGTICLSDDLTSHGNQTFNGVTDDKPKNLEFSEKNDNEDKISVDTPVVEQSLENEDTEKVANDNVLTQMDSANDASPVPQKTVPPIDDNFNIPDVGEGSNPQDCHDFNKTIDAMDGELLEKVNLDQSSADEMEEDTLDTKLVDSDNNLSKMNESNKEPGVGVGEGLHHFTSKDKLVSSNDHVGSVTALPGKRKFQDSTKDLSNEPPKRQRRWNIEGHKEDVSIPRKSDLTLQTASSRPNISGSNSSPRIETPKERVVPPSEKIPTTSLKIDNFVRPFTLKAVHELLGKTGNICNFWMDNIKTHCYVTFSSADEAIETRNAVYNLQWPTNGGRLLVADFVDPEDVKLRAEGLLQSSELPANANPVQPTEPTFQQVPKQHQQPQHALSRVPPARDSSVKDQLPRVTSPVDEKVEAMPTLDDLFRKTKATPRIYYLPLTDKEVAAKVSRQKVTGGTVH